MASADTVGALEEDVMRFFNESPGIQKSPWPVVPAGAALVNPISAIVVLAIWRKGRLAVARLLAGGAAGAAHEILDNVIELPVRSGLGFVLGHTAVASALATVASSCVPGRWKWLLWALPVATLILRIYTRAHLPLDVVGGVGLGVAVGGAVNLALGVTARQPADRATAKVRGS